MQIFEKQDYRKNHKYTLFLAATDYDGTSQLF